jgi:hypothetical protein
MDASKLTGESRLVENEYVSEYGEEMSCGKEGRKK